MNIYLKNNKVEYISGFLPRLEIMALHKEVEMYTPQFKDRIVANNKFYSWHIDLTKEEKEKIERCIDERIEMVNGESTIFKVVNDKVNLELQLTLILMDREVIRDEK